MEEDGLIKVKYVQRVWKGQTLHLYFRRGDYREGPLSSPFGTQDLQDEVDAIVARLDKAMAAVARPRPGTVGGMLRAYTGHVEDGKRTAASAEFLALAASTQISYQDLAEELVQDIGALPLGDVTRSWIKDLRNAWAVRGHRAANLRMQVLKNALADIIDDDEDDRIAGDPFHRVKKVKRPSSAGESHPIWTAAEEEAAIEDAIRRGVPGLARAIALARYAGFRRGTVCALPLRARIKGPNDDGVVERRLYWITEKRKVLCDKREDPRLTALIARTPSKAVTVAYNADGRPWREYGLNQALKRHLNRLATDGKVRGVEDAEGRVTCPLTLHGLRHSRGVELAMADASDAIIMAQLEHATERAAKEYRRQAQRRKLADQGQDQVDNVVKLRQDRLKLAAT